MTYTKQTIAVIGARNNFGNTLVSRLCEGNYRIVMFDENLDKATSLRDSICGHNKKADIDISDCEHTASWEADIILVAAEVHEMRDIAEKIVTVATQKIVAILSGEGTELILNEVEELFPYSKVSILFPGKKKEVALFSRDKRSVETLKDLLHENGYNPVIQQREMTEQERKKLN